MTATPDHDKPSPEARQVVKVATAEFGGSWKVQRFYDDDKTYSVDMLICTDTPHEGFTIYSTVGVYSAPNMLDDKDVRVELAGVAESSEAMFPNVLASAAFQVQKDRWLAAPGVVFPNLVSDCELSETMQHMWWSPPFLWENLGGVEITQELTVHWLLGVPISEAERQLVINEGYDALAGLLERNDAEYYDLHRSSLA